MPEGRFALAAALALGACVPGQLSLAGADGGSPDAKANHPDGSAGPENEAPDVGKTEASCPPDAACHVACSGSAQTTIRGTVYDPALRNPLYGVYVYVPGGPLAPLPKGVPAGADQCSCGALYRTPSLATTMTGADGTFTLKDVPAGASIPLVLQVGKWRRLVHVDVEACKDNPQADKSLALPSTVAPGDTDDNMPDIAVSTGSADSLECLMIRMGLPATEYVAGGGSPGHVHVFSGGDPMNGGATASVGQPEQPPMPGAPSSPTALWGTQTELMPFDVVLLSCEGGETYAANPPALEQYLAVGGRVFASHFQYAWFAGPLESAQTYRAPLDWGPRLAAWSPAASTSATNPIGGIVDVTLNGSVKPFPKGVVFASWLTNAGALGQDGVPASELAIYQPRYNAIVVASDTASQPWITSDSTGMAGATMFFSFNTPVTAPGAPCGRAVYSDLHVGGAPTVTDTPPPPGGCSSGDLSAQEKALEFMLFDLSSCVLPDAVPPPGPGSALPK